MKFRQNTTGRRPILYTQIVHRAVWLTVFLALACQAQPPRTKATDYPAHIALPNMEIGAEYLVHGIPTEKGFYFTKEYLVVDVAVFLPATGNSKVSDGQFRLRINHSQFPLPTDSPGTVAASLKYPDWEQRGTLTAQAGPVVYGPSTAGRFPGDHRDIPPLAPPVKDPPDPTGASAAPAATMEELLAHASFSERPGAKAFQGCVYFRFHGKTKSIKSLDLVYSPGDGSPNATLPLF